MNQFLFDDNTSDISTGISDVVSQPSFHELSEKFMEWWRMKSLYETPAEFSHSCAGVFINNKSIFINKSHGRFSANSFQYDIPKDSCVYASLLYVISQIRKQADISKSEYDKYCLCNAAHELEYIVSQFKQYLQNGIPTEWEEIPF